MRTQKPYPRGRGILIIPIMRRRLAPQTCHKAALVEIISNFSAAFDPNRRAPSRICRSGNLTLQSTDDSAQNIRSGRTRAAEVSRIPAARHKGTVIP